MILLAFALTGVTTPPTSSSEARRMLQDYARCTVKHQRSLAAKAVVEDWPPSQMASRHLLIADCLHSDRTLTAYPPALMSALGEALAVSEPNELGPVQVATAPALAHRQPEYASNLTPDQLAQQTKRFEVHRTEQVLGECVVHADPTDSRALLGTRIDSEEENSAARKLVPALSGCLSRGVTLALTPEIIREAVGLAYYRLEAAARGIIWRP